MKTENETETEHRKMNANANRFPIPEPLFKAPGSQHALIAVTPATQDAPLSIRWVTTDDEIFRPDLRRAIDAVIRRSPFSIAPRMHGPTPCIRFIVNITVRNGDFEIEPLLARFGQEDCAPVALLIDRLISRLNSLLKSAPRTFRAEAAILHGRN